MSGRISGKNRKGNPDYYDYSLLAVVILLTGFGLVMLYSTSSYVAEVKFGNDMYYFSRQALISLAAIVAAILISRIDYHILMKLGGWLFLLSIALMALVRTRFGITINHARRWVKLGPFQFQPSEIAKIAIIVFVPLLIVKMGKNFKGFRACVLPMLSGILLAGCAYVLTENLSTGIIIFLITFFIIFVAHPKTAPFIILMVIAAAAAGLGVWALVHYSVSGSFRIQRILVWLNPEKYSEEGGYQIMQALYALGSGGIFGKGLGNSTQKLGSLPEAQNDMIFSIVCEELGVFGGIILILLFVYLLYRLFFIARNANDLYGSLMVTGIFAHIALQVILNICVVLNLIPTTGITLPFVSYGGTSVLFLMMEMSIALSVSRGIRFQKEERDLWGSVVEEEY
ncbi:MAG: putative lipid II flippase FtsW [Lachnospiraceae bacterium]|jgi:cell division protein FtsW|nr:putative lipid II flippase FtsW [Lachnospiraceae bacterium]MCI1726864.1 putative lipid II flippase FtsW [Lachnospiraceae bacterium]